MEERENASENEVKSEELTVTEQAAIDSARQTKRMKRRIIIVFLAMILFAVIYFTVSSIITQVKEKQEEETSYRPNTIIFYEADYEYNIMKDKDYLALDRRPYLCDEANGVTVSVEEDQLDKQDEGFRLLYDMVQCIIRGDHEGYNALFSENYYAVEDNIPEDGFTMQQVYDIKFTKKRISEHTDGGINYTQYEYEVEYKIRKNNGTFRTDIGSDAARTQYFVISDSTKVDGEQTVLIDRILGYNVKQ